MPKYEKVVMSGLLNPENPQSKVRLLTAICLIMIVEHKKLSLADVVNATGMSFGEIRQALQNLVNLRLVKVLPTADGIPHFELLDEAEAREYLRVTGVSQNS
jgi:hypothetical protein